ncbi:NgoBV family restriction endonuclease [Aerococcaceae bacterium NML191219]|nr:NgoBV family restriction endonuclease [Aerococcaceae bacterium NML191219]
MCIKSLNQLFEITKEKLEGQHGTISITFANRTHIYTGNDVIGNCLQEWLPEWFKFLGVNIQSGEGTQSFPDFVANFDDEKYDMEVKAWNINNAPAFDLANFQSFLETTYISPGKLNAQYFILGYKPQDDGFSQGFIVQKVFLKHIWEITSYTKKYPIGLQVKRNMPYAMRPYNFHKNSDKSFKSKVEFLTAVKEAFEMFPNPALKFSPNDWFNKVSKY